MLAIAFGMGYLGFANFYVQRYNEDQYWLPVSEYYWLPIATVIGNLVVGIISCCILTELKQEVQLGSF